MSWDLTIKRGDGVPLGETERVKEAIQNACPGVEFYREPSGPEKLAAVPEVEFPEVLREHFQTAAAQAQGDLEGPNYSLRFFLGEWGVDVVDEVDVEARGTTRNALPLLERPFVLPL